MNGADLEQAIADLVHILSDNELAATGNVGRCTKALYDAYVGDLPYRRAYWTAHHVDLACCCGAKGRGKMLDLLLAGWRPRDEVNYTCPACTKDMRRSA